MRHVWWGQLLVMIALLLGVGVRTNAYAGDALVAAEDPYAEPNVPINVASSVGASPNGLPGIARVAVASPRDFAHAAAALGLGYGFTESQSGEGGSGHHRALGSLALAVQPLRFLAAAFVMDGRIDSHPDDRLGSSSSTVGEPRLIVRGNEALSKSIALGAQLSLWVPGGEAPSLRFDASTLDAKLLATYAPPRTGLAVAFNGGYRLDRSANVLEPRERAVLRSGDRISLHLSDFDAVLLGVGASKRLGPVHTSLHKIEVVGEVTWDVLVGQKSGRSAPSALESPLLLGVGGRYHLKDEGDYFGSTLVEVRTELLLSERAGGGMLTPIDPRVGLVVGLRWAPALEVRVKNGAKDDRKNPDGSPIVEPPPTVMGSVMGHVTSATAASGPVANAHVSVVGGGDRSADTAADGSFAVTDVNVAAVAPRVVIVAKADGFEETKVEANIDKTGNRNITVDIVMKPVIKPGQLRGLVRSFNGKALAATIRIEPLGVETKTDADGTFTVDAPPGSYEIIVSAPGHVGQRRPVTVEQNGVTILNADLRPGKE